MLKTETNVTEDFHMIFYGFTAETRDKVIRSLKEKICNICEMYFLQK